VERSIPRRCVPWTTAWISAGASRCAYGQAEGPRDAAAIRHLDRADRIAPQRIRHDPVASELVHDLDRRARLRAWELESLKNRLGVGSQIVNC
jgi:hypothetical protein